MQSYEPVPRELLRGLFMAKESLEIGGGELDEGLEEVPLFSVVANGMPKSFEYFVAFPPVGVVVEVDPIQIFLRGLPLGRKNAIGLGSG